MIKELTEITSKYWKERESSLVDYESKVMGFLDNYDFSDLKNTLKMRAEQGYYNAKVTDDVDKIRGDLTKVLGSTYAEKDPNAIMTMYFHRKLGLVLSYKTGGRLSSGHSFYISWGHGL